MRIINSAQSNGVHSNCLPTQESRGCTGATFLAYSFNVDILAELVGGGLAVVRRQFSQTGEWPIEVARVMLTDAGRGAIEDRRQSMVILLIKTAARRHRRRAWQSRRSSARPS
jgi:hypothetical protein